MNCFVVKFIELTLNYYISILCEINYIHYNYTITTLNYTKTTFYLHNTYM